MKSELLDKSKPTTLEPVTQQLIALQRSYAFEGEISVIADMLTQVPALYQILTAALEPLRGIFGDHKLLQLEALASDDDIVLRVIVRLSSEVEKPAELMRQFKRDWWLKDCARSEASLVFDYEIGNGF